MESWLKIFCFSEDVAHCVVLKETHVVYKGDSLSVEARSFCLGATLEGFSFVGHT